MKRIRLCLGLALAAAFLGGCVRMKLPKEFKYKKTKEDPPVLEQLPGRGETFAALEGKHHV